MGLSRGWLLLYIYVGGRRALFCGSGVCFYLVHAMEASLGIQRQGFFKVVFVFSKLVQTRRGYDRIMWVHVCSINQAGFKI